MRLMRHPLFRDAHGTDDHYAPCLFAAGAAGDEDDVGTKNTSPAEVWELEQMCNVSQRCFPAGNSANCCSGLHRRNSSSASGLRLRRRGFIGGSVRL